MTRREDDEGRGVGGSGSWHHVVDALSVRTHCSGPSYQTISLPFFGQEMVVGNILEPASVEACHTGYGLRYYFAGIADLDDASTKPVETVDAECSGMPSSSEQCARADCEVCLTLARSTSIATWRILSLQQAGSRTLY